MTEVNDKDLATKLVPIIKSLRSVAEAESLLTQAFALVRGDEGIKATRTAWESALATFDRAAGAGDARS